MTKYFSAPVAVPDGEDDYDIVEYIPDWYYDDFGIKHIVVKDGDLTAEFRFVKGQMVEVAPF